MPQTIINGIVAVAALVAILDYFGIKPKQPLWGLTMPLSRNWKLGIMLGLLSASLGMSGLDLYRSTRNSGVSSTYANGDLEIVRNQIFAGKTIELDGKQFENCTFDQAELIFHGTKHFNMIGNKFNYTNAIKIRTDNPGAFAFWQLFMQLQEDNQWHLPIDVTLIDSKGNSVTNAVFNPIGHVQVVSRP